MSKLIFILAVLITPILALISEATTFSGIDPAIDDRHIQTPLEPINQDYLLEGVDLKYSE